MLTEECEELINKLTTCLNSNSILDEPTEADELPNEEIKKEKERLEKEYLELCV